MTTTGRALDAAQLVAGGALLAMPAAVPPSSWEGWGAIAAVAGAVTAVATLLRAKRASVAADPCGHTVEFGAQDSDGRYIAHIGMCVRPLGHRGRHVGGRP